MSRHPASGNSPSVLVHLAFALAFSGCDFGSVTMFELPQPTSVDVTFTLLPEDEGAAGLLGWGTGVPGAEVRLVAADTASLWMQTASSDETGLVAFDDVPTGSYRVLVRKMLSAEERTAVRAAGVVAFVEISTVSVRPDAAALELRIPASRTRSLIISEVRGQSDLSSAGTCCYSNSGYVELYNNADTTIYLDGKLIGRGFSPLEDLSPNRPCSMFDHLRVSPHGLWAGEFEMFPGSGRDYPLLPGRTAVIARDAIDHRPFTPTGLDLSGADFEFLGNADVDNPAVPNMINIGLRTTDRGMRLMSGVIFIAENVVPASLARDREPDTGREWALIPAERVLDVAVQLEVESQFPLCPHVIHPSLDRAWVHTVTMQQPGMSLQRRPLFTTDDERVILQHTRTSASDFFIQPAAPGMVREP